MTHISSHKFINCDSEISKNESAAKIYPFVVPTLFSIKTLKKRLKSSKIAEKALKIKKKNAQKTPEITKTKKQSGYTNKKPYCQITVRYHEPNMLSVIEIVMPVQ